MHDHDRNDALHAPTRTAKAPGRRALRRILTEVLPAHPRRDSAGAEIRERMNLALADGSTEAVERLLTRLVYDGGIYPVDSDYGRIRTLAQAGLDQIRDASGGREDLALVLVDLAYAMRQRDYDAQLALHIALDLPPESTGVEGRNASTVVARDRNGTAIFTYYASSRRAASEFADALRAVQAHASSDTKTRLMTRIDPSIDWHR